MANSWWEQQNQGIDTFNNASINSGIWSYGGPRNVIPRVEAPSDWDAFRKNFGGGNASEGEYKNWAIGQQRERTQADYVDRMASGDPSNGFSAQMQGDYDKYRGNLDAYLAQRGPQMDTSNRFEAGLAGNERRLNALLDDPESIRQTAAYKFRVGQGQEALQRSLAAKGMLGSGNRLMELTKYGQDMGSQEYDAQANRLSSLVGQYGQNWLGDKNANTQKYAAESNAWNQRGGLLSDIYGKAQQGLTSANKIGADNRLGWAYAWTSMNNKPMQYAQSVAGGPSIKWG